MITDVSFDLETLGSGFDGAIISLGAVAFNRLTGTIDPRYYYSEIHLSDAMRYGRVDADTLDWWMKQSEQARKVFADNKDKSTIAATFEALIHWMQSLGQFGQVCVWGNGSSFDITIIERHYTMLARMDGWTRKQPWPFWSVRDMRTIVDVANLDTRKLQRIGTHHNALNDAEFQAKAISLCFQKLAGKATPVAAEEEL